MAFFADALQGPEILALAQFLRQSPHRAKRQTVLIGQHPQPVLAALGPASPVAQDQVTHFLPSFRQSRIRHATCGLPSGEDGRGKGKPESMPWRGPAGKARHTGVSIPVWGTRGQSPWRSHPDRHAIQTAMAPLQRREAAGCPARAPVRQRASGNERGKSACGSGQKTPHPRERVARDRVRLQTLPLDFHRSRSSPGRDETALRVQSSAAR